tara:strand:+ start:34 stop:573 length:540 start_codon:yes stop_codon:yes gene_type:complete
MEKVKISKVVPNKNNPRIIKDQKFKKLVQSINEFPEMLRLRPIVVNKDMVVLGGNMRLKACAEAGLKEVWILKADKLTEDQQKEFIVKDNIGFGEWDWDILANAWDTKELQDWGMDVWNPSLESDYTPEYLPPTDNKQLTEEEYKKRKEQLDLKNFEVNKDFIDCLCPSCFHEFKVEKK